LFLRFVLVQSINFSAQIKGEDSFFIVSCWFLSNNLFITEEEWKRKKIKTKKDKIRRKRKGKF